MNDSKLAEMVRYYREVAPKSAPKITLDDLKRGNSTGGGNSGNSGNSGKQGKKDEDSGDTKTVTVSKGDAAKMVLSTVSSVSRRVLWSYVPLRIQLKYYLFYVASFCAMCYGHIMHEIHSATKAIGLTPGKFYRMSEEELKAFTENNQSPGLIHIKKHFPPPWRVHYFVDPARAQRYLRWAGYAAFGLLAMPLIIKLAWGAVRLLKNYLRTGQFTENQSKSKSKTKSTSKSKTKSTSKTLKNELTVQEKKELVDALETVDDPNIKMALALDPDIGPP